MKARTSLWASLAVAVSVGLAGCGGSSDNEMMMAPPKPEPVGLESGHGLTDGEPFTIKAGESFETTTGAMLTCPGETDCTVTVVKVADGSYTATSTGGKVDYEAPPVMESVYEMAKADIEAAETRAAAQDILDGVKDDVTGTEADMLQTAVDMRGDEVERAGRETEQKNTLEAAANRIDTSDLANNQDKVNDARMAIAGLRDELENNTPDVSEADKSKYRMRLTAAQNAVDTAQGGIDTDTRRTTQMSELETAASALQAALDAFAGKTATEQQLTTARNARTALKDKIDAAIDLTDPEKDKYQDAHASAEGTIAAAQSAYDTAETNRGNREAATRAATAKKLYDGIKMQAGTVDGGANAVNDFNAFYSGNDIHVVIGGTDSDNIGPPVPLTEDKPVTTNHGWEGKRYTDAAGGDSYEAMVYSNVKAPKEGNKFGQIGVTSAATGYMYGLDAKGEFNLDSPVAARVASSDFDHTAGVKEFKGDNQVQVRIPGSYHGVSGTYYCTPSGSTCAVRVAAKGFDLGTTNSNDVFTAGIAAWVFKPTSPEARVTEAEDDDYSSYGWWLKKTADDQTYTASAFHDFKGTDGTTIAVPNAGTAKYEGGATGKYAFSSSTGGLNEAGHFTAKAVLTAKFGAGTKDTITGTIDAFKVGDDGEDRTWVVHLHEGDIGSTGGITRSEDNDTTWEMMKDDTNASASGDWSGKLREQGDDGVPGAVTGVFYSEYGNTGKMVGAFGATE